ncbi:hypothetical protein CLV30_12831 [Haloactinopolyspora alba]|uniref:Uncharacterized protein n=1 Tax=Haloactinopolyspora alba TaxID=648780 RepID=A0A2P8DEZ8_9ACTN|nr:hypothetical protein [Haloactinopolyspora alba]PSK95779.1 hypothetical protein CLV30_12831 [Haloactinopolyspora alba]
MGNSTSFNRMTRALGLRLFGSGPVIGFDTDGPDGGGSGGSSGGDDGGGSGSGSGGDSGGSGDGGQGGDSGASGGTGGDGGADGGQGGTGGDTGGQGTGDGSGSGGPDKVEDLPEWAQKLIRDTRKEAGDHRTSKTQVEKKYNDALDGIAKALGLKEDDTPPDPAKLAEELDSTKSAHRSALVELAVFKAAGKYSADPEALTDSRSFVEKLEKLDPSAEDFNDKLRELVKKTVEDEPKFKVQGQEPPAKTGGDFTGGSGDSSPPNQLSVEEQRKARSKARKLSHDPS